MLLRTYRVTDKIGLIIVKMSAALGDWLLSSASILRGGLSGGISGLFGFVLAILALLMLGLSKIAGLLWLVLRGLMLGLMRVLRFFGRLLFRAGGAVPSAGRSAFGRVAGAGSGAMARRAARAEVDMSIREDPLRIQNRRLSVMLVIFGALLVGTLLWATDPARSVPSNTSAPLSLADASNSSLFNVASQITPEAGLAVAGLSTPIPTATRVPEALRSGGMIAFTARERGQTDVWAINVGSRTPIRILNDISDERDATWNPQGTRLAYASRQDGNWELYIYDLATQATTRLTYDLSFQGRPTWSQPDGEWLAYESYQGNNLDIYAVRVDGTEAPVRITDHPSPDFSPAWSPDGRRILFVSLRDGNQDVYVFDLDTLETTNITRSPLRNEDYPAWSPDGRQIAYSALEQGAEKVFVQGIDQAGSDAQVISFGRAPVWSPDGSALAFTVDAIDRSQTYLYAVPLLGDGGVSTELITLPYGATLPSWSSQVLPPALVNAGGLPLSVTDELYVEQVSPRVSGAPVGLSPLAGVQAPYPNLSDRVDDSFNALRERLSEDLGWDLLRSLDDAWWDINRRPDPGEERRNWHMTGRAFAIQRSNILGFPPPMEIVREDIGVNTYWRVYIRVEEDLQNGQLGEPMRRLPWDLLSRTEGDVQAYNEGGRLRSEMPSGYYVDVTQFVEDFGWERMPAGTDWIANSATINYWMFRKPEGLDWTSAMLEIYTESQLGGFAPTPIASTESGG